MVGINTYKEPIITNKGLMKHVSEKDFGVLIKGKGKKAQSGELIFYNGTYAVITEGGGKIILIPGQTRVSISPSQRAINLGRHANRYYDYVNSSKS